MAGLDRKVKAMRRQTKQAEKRTLKAAKKQERKAALNQRPRSNGA
jgi:hypothetical protein